MAGSTETASRVNFNPDWMSGNASRQKCPSFSSSQQLQQGKNGDKSSSFYQTSASANELSTVLAPPIMAKNRYGREELLALFSTPAVLNDASGTNHAPPVRLGQDFDDFFIEEARTPICMQPYSDVEQQLLVQGGINSSKVISTVNHVQQRFIHSSSGVVGGGGQGQGGYNATSSSSASATGGIQAPPGGMGQQRWGGSSGGAGPQQQGQGGRGFGRGSGGPPPGVAEPPFYNARGARGDPAPTTYEGRYVGGIGRGNNRFIHPPGGRSVGGGGFVNNEEKTQPPPLIKNTRAQGLVEANSLRDRTRPRLRSTGRPDDDESSGPPYCGGGGHGRLRQASSSFNDHQQRHLPEWATDENDEDDAGDALDSSQGAGCVNYKLASTGSFDSSGNFRADEEKSGESTPQPGKTDGTGSNGSTVIKLTPAAIIAAAIKPSAPSLPNDSIATTAPAAATDTSKVAQQPRRQPQTFAGAVGPAAELPAKPTPPPPPTTKQLDALTTAKYLAGPASATSPKPSAPQNVTNNDGSRYLKGPQDAKQQKSKNATSSSVTKRSDEDVLSTLHLQAESWVHSVFLEDSDTMSMTSAKSNLSSTMTGVTSPPDTGSSVSSNLQNSEPVLWYYIDPSDKYQGPFSADMMIVWFNAGYFALDLRVRTNKDVTFQKLGDLIQQRGSLPFATTGSAPKPAMPAVGGMVSMQPQPAYGSAGAKAAPNYLAPSFLAQQQNAFASAPPPPQLQPSQQLSQVDANLYDAAASKMRMGGAGQIQQQLPLMANVVTGAYNVTTTQPSVASNGQIVNGQANSVWDVNNSSNVSTNPSVTSKETIEKDLQALLERLKHEETLRFKIEEESKKQLKQREDEMKQQRQQEENRMHTFKQQIEKENAEKERQMRREIEAENEHQLRLIEKQHSEEIERRRQLLEQQQAIVAEEKRKQEMEKQRLEEQQRQRLEEKSRVEQEKRRNEDERLRLMREQNEQEMREVQRLEGEKRRRQMLAAAQEQQKQAEMAKNVAATGCVWSRPTPVVQQQQAAVDTRTLKEIQMEEERQINAERRQQLEQELFRKETQDVSIPVAGAWGSSSNRGLKWEAPAPMQQANFPTIAATPTPPRQQTPQQRATKSAWSALNTTSNSDSSSAPGGDNQASEGFWDDEPSKEDKKSRKPLTFVNSTQNRNQSQQQTNNTKSKAATRQVPELLAHTNADHVRRHLVSAAAPVDEFSLWCVKQVVKLNKEIDESEAAVFIEFLKNVPDIEVTDYVLNYIPESAASKEFLREFVERRKRAKLNNGTQATNEWSVVNAKQQQQNQSGSTVAENQQSLQQSRKRNKKGSHVKLLDSSALGFKATSDPNRFNAGEIDSPM